MIACTPFDPAKRGFLALYRENEVNHCPGCGRTHWHVGRITAECAFCATAMPIDVSNGSSTMHRGRPAWVPSHG